MRKPRSAFWRVLLALDVVLLVGVWLGVNLSMMAGTARILVPRQDSRGLLDATFVYLLFTGIAAFCCLRGIRGTSKAALRALGFVRVKGTEHARGVLWGAGLLAATVPLQLILGLFLHPRAGPDAQALVDSGWGVILAVCAVSALGEEALFRGALQPRMGLHAQAGLFALLHLHYSAHWPDMVLPPVTALAAGYAFGHLRRRHGHLWAPIWAHTTFSILEVALGRAFG